MIIKNSRFNIACVKHKHFIESKLSNNEQNKLTLLTSKNKF